VRGRAWFAPPGGVLALALGAICLRTHTIWPWRRVVHEDGHHTLVETVFYFEHAMRELPADVVLGVAVAGAVLYFRPRSTRAAPNGERDLVRWRRGFGALTSIVLLTIVAGTIMTAGIRAVWWDLAQMPTRPGVPLIWGAHWRYHLIERFAMMLIAFAAVGIASRGSSAPGARFPWMFGTALLGFVILTGIYGLTAEPFLDARFLGHQAREFGTHALVTLPIALGTCLALANRLGVEERPRGRVWSWPVAIAGTGGLVLGAYLAVAVGLTRAEVRTQTSDVTALVAVHLFEHTLTYLLVALLAGFLYLCARQR
jgi:hypothetical protein